MLIWAKTQEKNGWSDIAMRDDVLLPLLDTILPKAGLKNVKEKWTELIGNNLLNNTFLVVLFFLLKCYHCPY